MPLNPKLIESLKHLGDVIRTGRELINSHPPTSTGIFHLDSLLGGGWRPGVSVISGEPGTGKSLICAFSMAKQLQNGKPVLVVDTENSFELWQNHLDLGSALLLQPPDNPFLPYGYDLQSTTTTLTEQVAWFHQNGTPVGLVVIDSLAGFLPRSEQLQNGGLYSDNNHLIVSEQYTRVVDNALARLHKLALDYHFPILITQHDYDPAPSFYHANQYTEEGLQEIVHPSEQNIKTSLAIHSTATLAIKSLYHSPQDRSQAIAPFIAPGHIGMRGIHEIDFDYPTSLLLHVTLSNAQYLRHNDVGTVVPVPFDSLYGFQYTPPTSLRYEARHTFRTGAMLGDSDDYESADWE